MKKSKIFIQLILTLAGLCVFFIGLSRLYDFALQQNCNIKIAYVQKEKIDADILFLGPCEPLWMISPEIIDKQIGMKSYNLALSHSDFADNYLHLYFYLKNNKSPECLYLYVTPESMDLKYNTFNTYRFAPYVGDAEVDSVLRECDPAYYRWVNLPFMKYAYYSNNIHFNALQGLKHYFNHRKLPYFPDGYEPPFQVKWDNHLEKFIHLYPNGYNFDWNQQREKYFCKTIELAQQKGIKVYLFESPVLKESLKYQPNRELIIERIKAIAVKYKVSYKQFDKMKIAESREYFMSTLNTNLKGSAIFNDTLASYINSEKKK